MFGLLKKKINSFISSIVQKEEETKPEEKKEEILAPEPEKPVSEPKMERHEPPVERTVEEEPRRIEPEKPVDKPKPEKKKETPIFERPAEREKPIELEEKPAPKKEETKPEPKPVEKPEPVKVERPAPKKEEIKPIEKPVPKVEEKRAHIQKIEEKRPAEKPAPRIEEKKLPVQRIEEQKPPVFVPRQPEKEEKKLGVKLSLGTRIRSFISSDVEIKEGDVGGLLDELNLALLESDVAYEVAEHMVGEMRRKLVGMKVPKGSVDSAIKTAMRESLLEVLSGSGIDIDRTIREKQKPVKILLLGPNGAGKTTTMAKLAKMLMNSGHSCVFSASDTFRAAAIEQAEKHGEKLGIRVIKHKYGADPTAVAFDAVNYARSHNIDVVLIDSAGRQETNRNLLDEMKKIARVVNPDLKLFIGESIAGNALVAQVKSFSEAVGLDGVILTKLDCDAKGGTALSLAKATGVPILYFGIGQRYEDLIPFSAEYVVNQILD